MMKEKELRTIISFFYCIGEIAFLVCSVFLIIVIILNEIVT